MSATTIERKAVLVTGAATGIGEATVRELVRRGFHVYAGVRREVDGARLVAQLGPRCTPIALDVTKPASIAAAVRAVAGAGGVYGLVNNAGIAISAPLEFIPLDELRRQFEVNVYGAVAVTQAMLPLLRRSLGRIVNVGSIGGRTPLPIAGPYGASKAALDSLTQSLRMELAPFDIAVAYIEPGSHRTPIWERSRATADALEARSPELAHAYYDELAAKLRALADETERAGADPSNVARAIAHALQAQHPRQRYTIGADTRLGRLLGLLPQALRGRLIMRKLETVRG